MEGRPLSLKAPFFEDEKEELDESQTKSPIDVNYTFTVKYSQ